MQTIFHWIKTNYYFSGLLVHNNCRITFPTHTWDPLHRQPQELDVSGDPLRHRNAQYSLLDCCVWDNCPLQGQENVFVPRLCRTGHWIPSGQNKIHLLFQEERGFLRWQNSPTSYKRRWRQRIWKMLLKLEFI